MNNLRKLFTLLNLHVAGVVLLLGLNLFLLTRLFIAWHAASSDQSADYESERMTYVQLQTQMSHLAGTSAKSRSGPHGCRRVLREAHRGKLFNHGRTAGCARQQR